MTDDDARKLAQRMVDTWPTGPKAYIWRDVFIALEASPAASAYRTLVTDDTIGKAPTTGNFHAHYRKHARRIDHDRDNQPTGPSYDGPVMPLSDPRAAAAFARGYAQGKADLAEMRTHLGPNQWGPSFVRGAGRARPDDPGPYYEPRTT